MEKVVLKAERRSVTGKKVGALRRAGKLPAVLYGHHFDATPIMLDRHSATITLNSLTSSSLVTIDLEGSQHAALVREKQRNYVKNELLHVDFQVVSLNEKIRTKVSIDFTGTAPAVKNFNGVVVYGLNAIDVECFPQDLPQKIEISLSDLNNIGSGIYVRDVKISDKIAIMDPVDEMVVIVTGTAEEVEAVEGTGAAEPEVIEKGKKEEIPD